MKGPENLTAITCSSVGVAGTTLVHFRRIEDMVVARVGIAIFGMTNCPQDGNGDPFDPYFRDNYAEGVGADRDQAILALQADIKSISDSLWAE